MPGKLCYGNSTGQGYRFRESRAYCEGRQAASDGALTTTNPHPADSPAAVAWLAGHTSWTADPAGGPGYDCCGPALLFGGGYTP